MTYKNLLLLAAGAYTICASLEPVAWAQEDTTGSAERRLDAITVTAQKTEQSVLDVPLAVSVLDGDFLQEEGASSLSDLSRIAPSVTFNDANSVANSGVNIRGVGTSVFDIQVEPTTSFVVDDVSLGRQGQALIDLIDIERVEVLRGPQGTLFGKNATGGVINVVTRAPSEVFSYDIEARAAEGEEYALRGTVSGPISDSAGLRLTGYYTDREGHIENTFDSRQFNGKESAGLRGKLVFDIDPSLTAELIADYRHFESDGNEETTRFVTDPTLQTVLAANGVTPGEENRRAYTFGDVSQETDDWGLSLMLSKDMGAFELVSVSSYRNWEFSSADDVDPLASDPNAPGAGLVTGGVVVPVFGIALAGPLDINQASSQDLTQWTQELRLAGEFERWQLVGGLFASGLEIDRTFFRSSDACIAPLGAPLAPLTVGGPCIPNALVPPAPGFPPSIPDLAPLSLLVDTNGDVVSNAEVSNYAAFGQATFALTDTWSLLGGLRIQNDDVSFAAVQEEPTSAVGLSPVPFSLSGNTDETVITGKAGLLFEPNDYTLLYATYSRGSKAPTFDFDTATGAQIDVDPETSDAYELGFRAFLSESLLLNAALFTTTYDDFQEQSFDDQTGTFQLQNVGEVRTQGLEVDALWRATDSLTLQGAITFLDAEIESFTNGPCFSPVFLDTNCNLLTASKDLSGGTLPNAPDTKFFLSGSQNFDLRGTGWNGAVRLSYSWQDDVQFSLAQNPNTIQDAYGLLHASVSLKSPDDTVNVTLFGRNLTDETYATTIFQDFTTTSSVNTLQFIPREAEQYVGISVRFRN